MMTLTAAAAQSSARGSIPSTKLPLHSLTNPTTFTISAPPQHPPWNSSVGRWARSNQRYFKERRFFRSIAGFNCTPLRARRGDFGPNRNVSYQGAPIECISRHAVAARTKVSGRSLSKTGVFSARTGDFLPFRVREELGCGDQVECAKSPDFRPIRASLGEPGRTHEWLAGAGGIEPPNGGIKIRCLTAWLRPNALTEQRIRLPQIPLNSARL